LALSQKFLTGVFGDRNSQRRQSPKFQRSNVVSTAADPIDFQNPSAAGHCATSSSTRATQQSRLRRMLNRPFAAFTRRLGAVPIDIEERSVEYSPSGRRSSSAFQSLFRFSIITHRFHCPSHQIQKAATRRSHLDWSMHASENLPHLLLSKSRFCQSNARARSLAQRDRKWPSA
jgi:hypothetical protein